MKWWVKVCLLCALVVTIQQGVRATSPVPDCADPGEPPTVDVPVPEPLPEKEVTGHTAGQLIETLVLYTRHARDRAGSDAAIVDRIHQARIDAHQVFVNSRVAVGLRFPHEPMVYGFTERGLGGTNADLKDFALSASQIRKTWQADLVVLVVDGHNVNGETWRNGGPAVTNVCGVGYMGGKNKGGENNAEFLSNRGFSIVELDCLPGGVFGNNHTFIHELGHNMGLAHDRDNASTPPAYPFGHGYRMTGQFSTIMAYNNQQPDGVQCNCPRIPFFSNPDVTWNNGVADLDTGVAGVNDEALALRRAKAYVDFFSGFDNDVLPAPSDSGDRGSCGYRDWYAVEKKASCDSDWQTDCVRKDWCGDVRCGSEPAQYCWKPANGVNGYWDAWWGEGPPGLSCAQMGWFDGGDHEECFATFGNCVRKQDCGGLCTPWPHYCWKSATGGGNPTPTPVPGSTCAEMSWYYAEQLDECVAAHGSCVRKNVCGAGQCQPHPYYCYKPAVDPAPTPTPHPNPLPTYTCGEMGWWAADDWQGCEAVHGTCQMKQDCCGAPCQPWPHYCWKGEGVAPPSCPTATPTPEPPPPTPTAPPPPPPLGRPVMTGPTGATNSNPIYTWQAVAGAAEYYLWVNHNGTPVIQVWYPASAACAGSLCSVVPSASLANGDHTAWVQARASIGDSLWSTGVSFTVAQNTPIPTPTPGPSGATVVVNGSAAPLTVTAGASVTVTVSGGPGLVLDWVGLYAATAIPPTEPFLKWKYLSNTEAPPVIGMSSATLTFAMPVAGGSYNFRFFRDNGYTLLATSAAVTVTPAANATPSVDLDTSPRDCVQGTTAWWGYTASDPDGDPLTFSASCGGGGSSLAGHASNSWIECNIGQEVGANTGPTVVVCDNRGGCHERYASCTISSP
jgi:hypothetical protein